jgi:transcription initiation factor TFIIB
MADYENGCSTFYTEDGRSMSPMQEVNMKHPLPGHGTINPDEVKGKRTAALENLIRAKKYNGLDWKSKRIVDASDEILRITSPLGFASHIQRDIFAAFKKLAAADYLKGRKILEIIPALILEFIPLYQLGISMKEVLRLAQIENMNEFQTCRRNLHDYLANNPILPPGLRYSTDPSQYMGFAIALYVKNANDFGITEAMQQYMSRSLQRHYRHFVGENPRGIAAGATYFSCMRLGIRKSQGEIADVFDVTEVTLRKAYKKLCALLLKPKKK